MKGLEITLSFIGMVIRICILIICVFVIYNVGKKAYDFGFRIFSEGPMSEAPGRDIIVSTEEGDGLTDIAKKLEDKGLVSDWMIFFAQAKLSENKGTIEPGTYTLNTSMDSNAMMAVLTRTETEDEEGTGEEPAYDSDTPGDIESGDYDNSGVVESGSELVDGDLMEGEIPYAGEGGEAEAEETESDGSEGDGSEPSIDITVGE